MINRRLPPEPDVSRVEAFWVFAAVFFSGVSIMVIELLGTRLIAPFYGTSLYVWTSLIAVTMMALAVGYYVGGRLSDKKLPWVFSYLLVLAGVLTSALPLLTPGVLEVTNGLGLRSGAFASAFVLFFPSLMLLGTFPPLAIGRLARTLSVVGKSSGNVYTLSTLGSIIGTLVLAYVLFPTISSHAIFKSLGFILAALGALVGFFTVIRMDQMRLSWVNGVLLLGGSVVSLGLGLHAPDRPHHPEIEVISEVESLYGWVRVMDFKDQDIRILTSDASVIGAETHSSGESRLSYQIIADVLPSLRPGMTRALLIGQGAGHIAMVLERLYGIKTDTIEIDPAVADAAVRYFGFRPSGEARVGDARYEVAHMNGPYDLIIHDCFTGGSEPTHLLTKEVFLILKRLLKPDGIMAINTVGFLDEGKNPAIASVARTIDAVFPYRKVFLAMPGESFNDFVMIGSLAPLDLSRSGLPKGMGAYLEARQVDVDSTQGVLLTDDFNPFEHLQLRKSEAYRQLVTEWLGLAVMIR